MSRTERRPSDAAPEPPAGVGTRVCASASEEDCTVKSGSQKHSSEETVK